MKAYAVFDPKGEICSSRFWLLDRGLSKEEVKKEFTEGFYYLVEDVMIPPKYKSLVEELKDYTVRPIEITEIKEGE